MKTLTTGHADYGVAQAIGQILGSDFASRRNGFDLCTDDGKDRLAQLSLEYDVFVNCAALWKFHQTLVLEKVWNTWSESGKTGTIINIGSTADVGVRSGSWLYPIEKKALRSLSRSLSQCTLGGNGIRVTYISPGYLRTPGVERKHPDKNKIEPLKIAELIKWLIQSPEGVNLHDISLDPIQQPGAR